MKRATKTKNKIYVKFNGHDFKTSLAEIKEISGRSFNPKTKIWTVPYTKENVIFLHEKGFSLCENLIKDIMIEENPDEYKDIIIPERYNKLYPFQQDCMAFMKYHDGRILLSLDQGLGKTATSLCFTDMMKDYPLLIIVPASIKYNWKKEYIKWINDLHKIKICFGYDSIDFYDNQYDIVIVNYDLFTDHIEKKIIEYEVQGEKKKRTIYRIKDKLKDFVDNNFKAVIIDECQNIKSEKSLRYNAVKYICKHTDHVLALSGTPIKKKTKEFFNILNILRSDLFPNRWNYLKRYCDPKLVTMGKRSFWQYDGLSNGAELFHTLKNNIMIRYMKEDVIKDLPEKIKTTVLLELEDYHKYIEAQNDIKEAIDKEEMIGLQKINILKQLVYDLKEKACFDFVDNLLENKEKIVLFCHHKKVIDNFKKRYKKQIVNVDGSVTGKKRQDAIDRFIKDKKCKIIIGNMGAMGVGIDGLQKVCDTVVFLEFPWNSADLDQCIDRLMRIGQKNAVNVYFLIGNKTIDEDIIKLIDEGRITFNKIMEGKDTEEKDLLKKLIENIRNKY